MHDIPEHEFRFIYGWRPVQDQEVDVALLVSDLKAHRLLRVPLKGSRHLHDLCLRQYLGRETRMH